MCGQHAANELITRVARLAGRAKAGIDPRETSRVADETFQFLRFDSQEIRLPASIASWRSRCAGRRSRSNTHIEVAIGLDNRRGARLKPHLGQLRLDKQRAKAHIDFSAIESAIGQRHARLPAKNGNRFGIYAERVANGSRFCHAGRAENVHQQRIGAHAGVKLAPAAARLQLRSGQRTRGLRVDFVEAPHPLRVRDDGRIGGIEEVSVPAVFRLIDNDRRASVALDMRAPACVNAVAQR